MKNAINYNLESISFQSRVARLVTLIKLQKPPTKRIDFNSLMEELLPEVKQYIKRQFSIALKNETLPKGKYKIEDFTDELYIQAYDHIQDFIESDNMHKWLFLKADEILEDIIIEEDFNNMFFKNIEDYTKEEWKAMEELFTRDGDGDLIMLEDLDDISYSKQNYTLEETFINHIENDLIEKINASLTKKEIHRQIESILLFLPFNMRTIFELSVYHKFESAEIAEIKKISVQQVNTILIQAKKQLSNILFNKR